MAYNNDAFNRTLRGAILRALQARLVTDNIVNRDLVRGQFEEPEDTVEVITMGEVQVNDYNGTFGAIQDIDGEPTVITADLKQSFRFKAATDDTASQMAAAFTQDGIGKLLRGAQKYVLGMYSQAGLEVTYDPTTDQIKDAITQVAIEMDEANAPDFGRWIVLPPEEYHAIKDELEDYYDPASAASTRASRSTRPAPASSRRQARPQPTSTPWPATADRSPTQTPS